MPRRYIPVALAAAVMLVISAAAYTVPDKPQKVPVRIHFANSGGDVLFSHLVHHRDYKISCEACHHDLQSASGDPLACGACHPVDFDASYVESHVNRFPDKASCVMCHHIEYETLSWSHDEHADDYAGGDCQSCHHGEDIEPEPMSCRECHMESASPGDPPSLVEAAHARCQTCHEDMFEQKLESCSTCHVPHDMGSYQGDYTSCAACHEQGVKELVLPRMSAFHSQCMDCHAEVGKGPYGEKECGKCHIQ